MPLKIVAIVNNRDIPIDIFINALNCASIYIDYVCIGSLPHHKSISYNCNSGLYCCFPNIEYREYLIFKWAINGVKL